MAAEQQGEVVQTKVGGANTSKLYLAPDASVDEQHKAVLWAALASYLPSDVHSIESQIVRHAEYSLALHRPNLNESTVFKALSLSVRDRLIELWKDTQAFFQETGCKRVAYLSMEFLLGRSLQNAIHNLDLESAYAQAMSNLGLNLEEIVEVEKDAGLGNGGLGRLAACFLDSLATLDYPAWGYGLRYTYGMFHQKIKDGEQVEFPDYWLAHGNPWEVERLDVVYPVRFYGYAREEHTPDGLKVHWEGGEEVLAVAYDTPIPGFKTYNTLNIRLWKAAPSKEFDLAAFGEGDFYRAIEEKQKAESITYVLYPNDNTEKGKELRLKQQYFFVSATLQDMFRRFRKADVSFDKFHEKVAVQLNDTHPSLAIVEMMRLLVDVEHLSWDDAWAITTKTFAYTNHTVLPEALEKWPVRLMEKLLPRHLRIIYDINLQFLREVEERWPGDVSKLQRMSIILEGDDRMVRMANLSIVGSFAVNGVAALHSQLIKEMVFPDFYELWPKKFQNKTNGVTPRRWIHQANPELSDLITKSLAEEDWLLHLDKLKGLCSFVEDEEFCSSFRAIKHANKVRLAAYIKRECDIDVNPSALFDVQVKRIHEYKRQLMNILGVIYRYRRLRHLTKEEQEKEVPRVVIFAGKAAPGYYLAKRIIKLINSVGDVVNQDAKTNHLLKVVFLPNYRVSQAEVIIPACDLSQQISTAGMEASGTGNMKFAMNGALIIGTLDGANIEIREQIGEDNMFIFGALAKEVPGLREKMRASQLPIDPRFMQVLGMIQTGMFGQPSQFAPIVESITDGKDHYLVAHDFPAYLDALNAADAVYRDQREWTKRTIFSCARSGFFSSDRTIRQYAEEVWNVTPQRRPGPTVVKLENLGTAVPAAEAVHSLLGDRFTEVHLEKITSTPELRGSISTSNDDYRSFGLSGDA